VLTGGTLLSGGIPEVARHDDVVMASCLLSFGTCGTMSAQTAC
jgi:hypothetical protein